jgi:zinc transport system substrate-binding protein
MLPRIVLVLILAAGTATTGCGGTDDSAGASDRSPVVAAFYPLAFAAEEIGRESVRVTNITPPGAEPHDVELSARDVERVRSAELVLYLGHGFQPALERAVEGADVEALDLLSGLELLEGGEDARGHEGEDGEEAEEHAGGGETALDPHVWLDPLRYAEMAERIGAALERPERAAAFAGRLRALDEELRDGLAACRRHELVTSHAAFGYLAERYDLEQIAITGLSPETEPTPRELEEVIDEVREHGATTVFFETLVSPRLAETVARETGAETAVLDPIEGLTEEELERGEDYFSIMRENLEALRGALGCR